jgi:hypothetical protein
MAVAVNPAYGARVTSFRDRQTGREWVAPGGVSGKVGEDAVYGADEAVGWDECFPTIAPFDARATPWGRVLRDHGDLWGRPAAVVERAPQRLTTQQAKPLVTFSRTLELDGKSLRAHYRLESHAAEPLPWLWAQHGLLRVTAGDHIILPGIGRVLATYLTRGGDVPREAVLHWPGPNLAWPAALDVVQSASAGLAAKLYVENWAGRTAYVGAPGEWLAISSDNRVASLGVWLNYGGWPSPGNVHHIALEPTNAPVDHLGQAIERGVPPLPPRAVREWTTSITLRASPPV